MNKTWFETLTGFQEASPEQVRSNLQLDGNKLYSKVNGRTFTCGYLETPSLEELRIRTRDHVSAGRLKLSEVVQDVEALHLAPGNAGALFQVASQFNLLEHIGPEWGPEKGISIYEDDHTQGPTCAIAAGAGTIYRNYFLEVNGQTGQSPANQIDCLLDMGNALGNTGERLWTMKNGYVLAEASGLKEIADHLGSLDEPGRDALRQKLRIGIQSNTQVTLNGCEHLVTQVYGSALPVAYSSHPDRLWADFAQLVLEASYEATLHAAVLNFANTGNNQVFLTFLGGGVFGNQEDWIFSAIERALRDFAHAPLEVCFVSFRNSHPRVQKLIRAWEGG